MIAYHSKVSTHGRNMAGARALWRATGVKDEDFGKPIIAVANSFTQFVPGHVHLKDLGQLVCREIEKSGGIAKEFNTIALDDGIAMGHAGMLYSLPSREIIADSIEYMVNGHAADGLICISNCDKITPGMLMASLRLNIPTIFVSGGPMEAGKVKVKGEWVSVDLVDAMVSAVSDEFSDEEVDAYEKSACPTCGSCSGMFTANSMNCLTEALGLAFPGNGSTLATHEKRKDLFLRAGQQIVKIVKKYYLEEDERFLPRQIANFESFQNAMVLDIAMGGSTNTVLHLLAAAHEGKIPFTMADIDRLSRKTPTLCKVAPSVPHYHMEDVHRAGGVMAILKELKIAGLLSEKNYTISDKSLGELIEEWDILNEKNQLAKELYQAAPGGVATQVAFSQNKKWKTLDTDREKGCVRSFENAYNKDGGLVVLYGNIAKNGCILKTAGVDEKCWQFKGKARIFESQDECVRTILANKINAGEVVVIRYEGPKGGPGMQEMLYPTSYLKSKGLGEKCALITDGRFSGGTSGLSIGHISPEAANQGSIALIEENDLIEIDIAERKINVLISETEMESRKEKMLAKKEKAYLPLKRQRKVSKALRIYAKLSTSADQGAVRKDIS